MKENKRIKELGLKLEQYREDMAGVLLQRRSLVERLNILSGLNDGLRGDLTRITRERDALEAALKAYHAKEDRRDARWRKLRELSGTAWKILAFGVLLGFSFCLGMDLYAWVLMATGAR